MDNKIILNGETYIKESAIDKDIIDPEIVVEYLRKLDTYSYVNIIEASVDVYVKKGYYDNEDIHKGNLNLTEKQILAIFLAVNNH